MARISLRAYSRDIEVMIDKNQIDEAFAHCRYILELYPKHIATYRLMGKALLEAQRFGDASDVFHRVLSSVPDDFIAHLGMSIIREDESNLDAAIWHMERSFEVQPSNAAVQVELRRLYGLRDGVTPQKIQLTRGALARMSAKSNLHSQAIAELRAALSNDPQRPDLQVVLAEMYLQTGSRMESIETCNALINKLPYCQAANRILAEILPETERADKAQEYKSRLGELDPYYLQLSPVAPTLEQVPDGAVTIERFEYTGESFEIVEKSQPAWAASLGVDLEDEQLESDEPAPDWLEESGTEGEAKSGSDQGEELISEGGEDLDLDEDQLLGSDEIDTPEAEEIPDWMGDIDESETTAAPVLDLDSETPAEEDEEMEESHLMAGEIEAAQEPRADEDIPDWMSEDDESDQQDGSVPIPGIAAAAGAAALGAVISGQEDDEPEPEQEVDEVIQAEETAAESLPDWMAEAGVDEDQEAVEDIVKEPPVPEEETPVEVEAAMAESSQDEEDETPDWMSESESPAEGETPDWLRDAMEGSDEEEESLPEAAALAAGTAILSDEDEDESDLIPEAEPHDDEMVEPLDEDVEQDLTADAGVAMEEAALVGAAAAGAVLGASSDSEDEMPSELADETELPADEESVPLSIDREDVSEAEQDVPDWLQDLGEDMPAAEGVDVPPLVFEDQPAAEEPIQEPGLDTAPDDAETKSEPETQPADDGEQIPEAPDSEPEEFLLESEFPESIPDWLSEVSPEEIPEEVAEAEAELDIVRAEIPVWLRKMEAQHKAELEAAGEVDRIEDLELEAEFTELSGEDVPSWLMSAMEPELPAEVDQSAEVEDISEVFETKQPVGIDEFGLESSAAEEIEADKADELEDVVDDLEFEELQDELVPEAAVPETLIEADETAEEIAGYAEESEDLIEPETEVESDLESEETAEELEAQVPEEEHEGIGVPGLAAAGAVAAHLLDEEDTQPVAVGEEPEITSDLEAVDIVEGSIVEDEAELPEVADEIERQIPEAEGEIIPQDELEEAEVSAIEADAPLSGEEQDAAMAWLESLAAKQGAAEEELLTPADERLEEPPEWIQEEASEAEVMEDEDTETRDTALTAAALAGVTAGIIAADDESPSEEDAAADDEKAVEPVAEEQVEEPSEWVPEIVSEEELETTVEAEVTSEEVEIETGTIEIEEEPDIVEELAAAAEVDLDQVEAEETPEEIPDWLSGLAEEQEAAVEPETTDWTPDMLAEEVEEPTPPVEAVPAEKLDLNAASLSQLEKIPGIGFILAQNIVNHRAASGSFTDLEQLGDVEGLTPEIVADLEDYLTVEVVKEVSTTESEIPELQEAWNNISEGNIEGAVDQYTELINQEQYLDEVIRDLQSALSKYPSDSSLYQSLGDAYMRTNMLQEALDAYNRAEDLI